MSNNESVCSLNIHICAFQIEATYKQLGCVLRWLWCLPLPTLCPLFLLTNMNTIFKTVDKGFAIRSAVTQGDCTEHLRSSSLWANPRTDVNRFDECCHSVSQIYITDLWTKLYSKIFLYSKCPDRVQIAQKILFAQSTV